MGRLRTKRYGTRAEVWHGKARMTQGRLTKEDFVMNEYGYIVSKRKSKLMKSKENPLRQKGLLQKKKSKNKKGKFGPQRKKNKTKNKTNKNKTKNKTNKNKTKNKTNKKRINHNSNGK
jgi:hypothetical protein